MLGISQRVLKCDPLGTANPLPENLAGLITSTVRNLNNPGGAAHTTKAFTLSTPAGYNNTQPTQNAANNGDMMVHDDPRRALVLNEENTA